MEINYLIGKPVAGKNWGQKQSSPSSKVTAAIETHKLGSPTHTVIKNIGLSIYHWKETKEFDKSLGQEIALGRLGSERSFQLSYCPCSKVKTLTYNKTGEGIQLNDVDFFTCIEYMYGIQIADGVERAIRYQTLKHLKEPKII